MIVSKLIANMEKVLEQLRTLDPNATVLGRSGIGDDSGIYGELFDFDISMPRHEGDEIVLEAMIDEDFNGGEGDDDEDEESEEG
jgi:hypothetical protein